VGTQLVSRPETLDDLFSQPDAEPGGNPWDERVPGRDGTLLAIVPIPGTSTSLAIVGYAIATTNGTAMNGTAMNGTAMNGTAMNGTAMNGTAMNGTAMNGTAMNGTTATGGSQQGRPAESDPATERPTVPGVRLDHVQRRAWAGGREIMLTFQEFQLLAFLTAHPATVFTRADLVEHVWRRDIAPASPGTGRDTAREAREAREARDAREAREARAVARDSRTVDVHVSRLRHKLGPVYGQCLVTEYRVGYQFRPPVA
jgi:DNA-binding response OmpR family regulator